MELIQVYLDQKIDALDPVTYEAWGVSNNFSQHRDIACMTIKHLANKGQPVVVGGSDASAEPQVY